MRFGPFSRDVANVAGERPDASESLRVKMALLSASGCVPIWPAIGDCSTFSAFRRGLLEPLRSGDASP